jgi:hypothetical protein
MRRTMAVVSCCRVHLCRWHLWAGIFLFIARCIRLLATRLLQRPACLHDSEVPQHGRSASGGPPTAKLMDGPLQRPLPALGRLARASGLVIQPDRISSGHSHPKVGSPVHSRRLVGKWFGEAEPGGLEPSAGERQPHVGLGLPSEIHRAVINLLGYRLGENGVV